MIKWQDAAKKSASALFHSAQSHESLEKVRKDIGRACRMLSDGNKKEDVWSGFFRDLSKEYNQLFEKQEDIVFVEVVVALPLAEEDQKRLEHALKLFAKKDVELEVTVDSSIIGGIIVKLQDVVFDDSVVHRLEMIKADIMEGH